MKGSQLNRRTLILGGLSIPTCLSTEIFAQDLLSLPNTNTHPPSDPYLRLPEGYTATLICSWGTRLSDGTICPLPIENYEDQLEALGYNNDFIAFHPLPQTDDGDLRQRGILSINHEYTNPSLMFRHIHTDTQAPLNDQQIKIEMAAMGHSVIEVRQSKAGDPNSWEVVWGSIYNRRLSALGPLIELSGPVAGALRVQTTEDPEGKWVRGTYSNCAGGQTPWGTTLIAEENFNQQFYGDPERCGVEATNHALFGMKAGKHRSNWYTVDSRFNIEKNPREPNRFGWIVELDPLDPNKAPVKRTALGRFKHECASCILTKDGRLAVYSGDDQVGEFIYRFITDSKVNVTNPKENWGILDHGVLQVAQFQDQGRLIWKNLIFGEGPLTPKNGFTSQADVLIETRRAARLLGATPLDRPEDIEISPQTGKVYVMCTQWKDREKVDHGSPRAPNQYGHILELRPQDSDHSSDVGEWEVLILGGPEDQGGNQGQVHWIKNPDNGAFDQSGHLWVTADAHSTVPSTFSNGLWRCTVEGSKRGQAERFCTVPAGAEPCGPCFTPDGRTLFVSIQHPGEGSSWDAPTTRWPDFRSDRPPRPSVIAISKIDGSPI